MIGLRNSAFLRIARDSVCGRCVIALALAILLSQCGGGEGKTGSNGTGAPVTQSDPLSAAGPISALGPTGIGGTALDDGNALVLINAQLPGSGSDIRLGMVAEVTGTIATNAATGTASTVTAQSAVIGPVASVDVAAQRLTILSVAIVADQNTILEGVSALANIVPGTRLEVYGLPRTPSNTITATRIIARPASGTGTVELLGNATGLSTNQFSLQGLQVSTTGASLVVPGAAPSPQPISSIGENARVRVIGTYNDATGTFTATQVIGGLNPVRNDNSIIVLDGLVQSVSGTGRFRVNETDVDATAAGAGALSPGTHVQVRGRKAQGILTSSEFRLVAPADRIAYSVEGVVTDFIAAGNFKVRGEAIDATAAVFSGGIPADLANGRRVRVKAFAGPGRLAASTVSFLP